MRALIIDHSDSFTYNLVHLLAGLGIDAEAAMEESFGAAEEEKMLNGFDLLVLSPGPGNPKDHAWSYAMVERWKGRIAMLGVCLGHQMLGEMSGMRLEKAPRPMHGKTSKLVFEDGELRNMLNDKELHVMRYHSLCINKETVGAEVALLATSEDDGVVMLMQCKRDRWMGMQFHPESVLSSGGPAIVKWCIQALAI